MSFQMKEQVKYNTSKQIEFNNLIYYFKRKNFSPINFINFRVPVHIYNDIEK